MKKRYVQPLAAIEADVDYEMICESEGVYADDKGIGYGGVDGDGQKDPDARQLNLWEEE